MKKLVNAGFYFFSVIDSREGGARARRALIGQRFAVATIHDITRAADHNSLI
jgi:hypothetical protein